MEVTSGEVQSAKQTLGPVSKGSVCQSRDSPTAQLHIMEGSTSPNECISLPVDGGRLPLPSIRVGGPSTSENSSGPLSGPGGGTPLGEPGVVHDTPIHVIRSPESSMVQQGPTVRSKGKPSPAGKEHTSDGLAVYRNRLREQGFSPEVIQVLTQSNTAGTIRQYQSAWGKWSDFCDSRGLDANPSTPRITEIANFLNSRYVDGIQYNQLNKYRSALSSFMPKVDGATVGQHPTIEKLMRAFYKNVPPRPRYSTTWSVDPVLLYWRGWPNRSLSLYQLGIKTMTLLSIATMGRSADMRNLSVDNYKVERDNKEALVYIELLLMKLPKQQRSGPLLPVRIYAVTQKDNINICPVATCLAYIQRTLPLRPAGVKELLLGSTKPHNAIKPKTGANWILYSMKKGGIDTNTFKAHSICSASVSSKAGSGVSIKVIMAGGRWSQESTVKKFYLRNIV
jgi:hypothetical protein